MRKLFGMLALLLTSVMLLPAVSAAKDRDDYWRERRRAEHEYRKRMERLQREQARRYRYYNYNYNDRYYNNYDPYGRSSPYDYNYRYRDYNRR